MRRYGLAGLIAAVAIPLRLGAAETRVSTPAELARAISSAKPGDTVVIADGSYVDLKLQLRGAGEEGRPITLRAATPGKVVLTGTSSLEMRGAWLVAEGLRFEQTTVTPITVRESQHCRVTGCAVVRCNPPDKSRLHWIRIAGANSLANRIDHCYTVGKLTDGVVLTVEGDDGKMPLDTRIDHNHFREVVRAVNTGMETIRVGTSQFGQVDSRTVVESNLFEGCSGDAEIISSKSCGNTYRWNTFRECDGAVTMRHGHRSLIEGNFFFGNGKPRTAGIRVHGTGHRVINNYLAGLGQYSIALPAGQSKFVPTGHEPTIDCTVRHNTIVEPAGPAFVLGADRGELRDTAPTGSKIDFNLVLSSRGTLVEQPFGDPKALWFGNLMFARDAAKSGDLPTNGVRLVDPRLERAADGLWRPAAGSPALGAAEPPGSTPHDDVDGQPRGGMALPDVGADQRSDAPILRRPLKPVDVGPAWLPR